MPLERKKNLLGQVSFWRGTGRQEGSRGIGGRTCGASCEGAGSHESPVSACRTNTHFGGQYEYRVDSAAIPNLIVVRPSVGQARRVRAGTC